MSSAHVPAIPGARKLPKESHQPRAHKLAWLLEHRAEILAAVAVCAIAAGGLLYLLGESHAGQTVWRAAVALLAAELTIEVGRTVVVERSLGVDAIALVAMVGWWSRLRRSALR
jgi:hypothetical protein